MTEFDASILKKLYIPHTSSHKGQNGKLMVIGGSQLFHAASLWSLEIASKIVDMVFYSSVPNNNEIVQKQKEQFKNGIIIPREKIEAYIQEADCILIGPGLPRREGEQTGDNNTQELTEKLLQKYSDKKWVIDGGSLQVITPELIPENAIITPHEREFDILNVKSQKAKIKSAIQNSKIEDQVKVFAKEYTVCVVLTGEKDIVSDGEETVKIGGGNAGMTKGGTGDVLAGLIAALYCKNNAFISAICGSYINKKAGDALFKKVGYYFNASDLVNEIPFVMKELLL